MQAGLDIYFYEDIAGIRPVESAPGYKRIIFEPCWKDISLESASATIRSRYGDITSSWEKKGGEVTWKVIVPAGCSASVNIPGSGVVEVLPGEHVFKAAV